MWRQRSKINWELQGDRGTRFFHAKASNNKNQNNIPHIEYKGSMHSDQKAKSDAFFQYYTGLIGPQSNETSKFFGPTYTHGRQT